MMDFPGRIYIRADDDIHSAEHQAMVQRWIGEFQKVTRQSFVFPEKHVRSFGYAFIVIGLLLLIIQVVSLVSLFYFLQHAIDCFFVCHNRLRCRLFNVFTFRVFSVRESGLDYSVWQQGLQEYMQLSRRATESQ